ncbi:MAG: hypothetical protein G8237_00615 [Magnetococcales bacterium]|nr:hypothetical protein [Magnetococcales bacterium]NGZ04842.1 hypothetical protein [Magnetococcales bacterium]
MVDLPGKRAQLEKQAQKAKTPAADLTPEQQPPSSEQLGLLQDQLRQEEEIVLAGKLEEVRKKREQELQRGKSKPIEKINVTELKFAREEKKAGLPENIRRLPKDHPVRVMYEKGFKQKGLRVPDRHIDYSGDRLTFWDAMRSIAKPLGILMIVGGVIAGLYYGGKSYQAGAEDTRSLIMTVIKNKNYRPDHPTIAKEFKALYWSNWLPDLYRLLDLVQGLGMNDEHLESNPEAGSYLEYIKRHNLPFDQTEAMEWYSREMRKSSR